MTEDTIKIAGGGISGLTCAIMLAKSGKQVHVFEKKSASGGRFWGDWQGLENWTTQYDVLEELKPLNLDLASNFKPLPELRLIDGVGLNLRIGQPTRPLCYLVKRGTSPDSFDQELYRAAMKAGVQFSFNKQLNVELADIVATGPRTREIFAIDKGIKFKTTHPDVAIAIVNNDAAYKGYAYLLVVDGYGCICTVMFDKFNQIHEHFDRTLEIIQKEVTLDMIDPKHVGGVGSFSNELVFQKDRRMYVGEAAGLQDLLWGFGIRSAIASGTLAAQSILNGNNYESEAKTMFADRLNSSIVIRYLFEKISGLPNGYAMMGKLVNRQANPMHFLRRAYGFTPLHRLIAPFAKRSMRKRYPALYI